MFLFYGYIIGIEGYARYTSQHLFLNVSLVSKQTTKNTQELTSGHMSYKWLLLSKSFIFLNFTYELEINEKCVTSIETVTGCFYSKQIWTKWTKKD